MLKYNLGCIDHINRCNEMFDTAAEYCATNDVNKFFTLKSIILQFDENLTFALFFLTLRKTTIPTARADRNKTVTTASPAINAGWSDKESIKVSFRLQKSLVQSICSVSGPEHLLPSFWGSG